MSPGNCSTHWASTTRASARIANTVDTNDEGEVKARARRSRAAADADVRDETIANADRDARGTRERPGLVRGAQVHVGPRRFSP